MAGEYLNLALYQVFRRKITSAGVDVPRDSLILVVVGLRFQNLSVKQMILRGQ